MPLHTHLEHGVSILHARLQSPRCPPATGVHVSVQPFVTLSRETGAGATTIGRKLVTLLNRDFGDADSDWLFLDKDLLVQALRHNRLPARFADFLPEDRVSEIQAAIGELVGLHPSLWELEHKVADAVVQLARAGRVLFAGRGAHLITRGLPGGVHVRLVASLEARTRRMAVLMNCDGVAAAEHVAKSDLGRRRFLRTHFGQDIDDPHLYDLVINTERIPPDDAARLIASALRDRLESERAKQIVFGTLPQLSREQLTPDPLPDRA